MLLCGSCIYRERDRGRGCRRKGVMRIMIVLTRLIYCTLTSYLTCQTSSQQYLCKVPGILLLSPIHILRILPWSSDHPKTKQKKKHVQTHYRGRPHINVPSHREQLLPTAGKVGLGVFSNSCSLTAHIAHHITPAEPWDDIDRTL